jgi:hypothetical protein
VIVIVTAGHGGLYSPGGRVLPFIGSSAAAAADIDVRKYYALLEFGVAGYGVIMK